VSIGLLGEEHNSPSVTAEGLAAAVYAAFAAWHAEFSGMTRRARGRFARREWLAARADATERLELYAVRVRRVVNALLAAVETAGPDDTLWRAVKEAFIARADGRPDAELAETFFNSVVRRVRHAPDVDPASEFVRPTLSAPRPAGTAPLHRTFEGPAEVALREALGSLDLGALWADLPGDARLGAVALGEQLADAGLPPLRAIELLPVVFYRNKGAYVVGRVRAELGSVPLLLPLVHADDGVRLDAVLTGSDEVSAVFGFTRSYFHADLPGPAGVIDFLGTLMPNKRRDELYTAIGYNKHGKTELYRALVAQLEGGARFEASEGDRGMVMAVFALPALNVVFKIIRDRFDHPKRTTRREVMERYDLVFRHDRVGRLADAQEFARLEFRRGHFDPGLLAELTEVAGETVTVHGDVVRLAHAYTERRVTPLNLFLRTAAAAAARDAVLDYGKAIKDLAAANIFPGDMLLKNFGVTRHGRVIFYDYDELSLLTDCRFRRIPPPRDDDDELSAEPWFHVGDRDVFPEEFGRFALLPGALGEAFLAEHADLFGVEFWEAMQRRQQEGEIVDFFPYRPQRRLRRS
jgi:isocitrate dehydrogenase kinase/phosphatase